MSRLLKLFASQKWVRALRLLSAKRRKLKHKIQEEFSDHSPSSSSSFNKKVKNKSSDCDQFTSIRNLLPAALTYGAPTYILKAIIDLNPNVLSIPSSISSISKQGNRLLVLPLQYACSIGASSKTIKTLLSLKDQDYTEQSMSSNISTTKAVSTNHVLNDDDENRTALHYAIQRLASCNEPSSCLVTLKTSSTHQSRSRCTFDEKETILTISYLLDAYPDAVLHLDKYNQTPIDMLEEATYSDQNLSRSKEEQELLCIVCNILRRTAVQVYRRRKEDWERQGCNCSCLHRNSFGAICKSVQSSKSSLEEEDEIQESRDENLSGVNETEEKHNRKKGIYERCTPIEKKDGLHTILKGYLV